MQAIYLIVLILVSTGLGRILTISPTNPDLSGDERLQREL